MMNGRLLCLIGGMLLLTARPAPALDLLQSWQQAQAEGAAYRAARYEREASAEERNLGRAQLLPNVSGSAYFNHINGTSRQPNIFGRLRESPLDYDAQGWTLQLRQPLFNLQKWSDAKLGGLRAELGETVFTSKTQDQAQQLAERYLSALLAQDNTRLAENKLRDYQQQLQGAQRRRELGEGTVIDVDSATAHRDLAQAELLAAQDAQLISVRALQELTGPGVEPLAAVNPELALTAAEQASLEEWLRRAEQDNPRLLQLQKEQDVAQEEIRRARAGHFPTLDFVASNNQGESESVSSINQRTRYTSIGVQLTVPLFAGGGVSAAVRQAAARYEQARAERDAAQAAVDSEVERQHRLLGSGAARVQALRQAEASAERALRSAQIGLQAGSSTVVDVYDAEEQLYQARRDLSEARLLYVLSDVRLQLAAGVPGDAAIAAGNRYLQGGAR